MGDFDKNLDPSGNVSNLGVPEKNYDNISLRRKLRFIIPSLIGVLLFMMPVETDGRLTVPVGHLIDSINDLIAPYMLLIALLVAVIPSILTVFVFFIPSAKRSKNRFVQLLNPGPIWTCIRLLGAITMAMVYLKAGPEWIWGKYTGGVLLFEVAPILLALYIISALLLPLLTEYGLMEFVGALISKPFKIMFNLPGKAAIDSMASWLSATSMGVILTTQQYRAGQYSMREAATIATSFSVVSVAFAYVVLKFIKMEHVFVPWYLSVVVAGIVSALIVPRLPPLRNMPNSYVKQTESKPIAEDRKPGEGLFKLAFRQAIHRADHSIPLSKQVANGFHLALDIAITVYPSMMIFGVLGLSIIEYTSVMHYLSMPLVPVLELLQLPEAPAAAVAISTGFIDLLMPVIIGSSIESELTRFVIAGVTVNGIIFLTEVALIMIRANIGLTLAKLAIIWVSRLLVSLPIFTLMGHLVL